MTMLMTPTRATELRRLLRRAEIGLLALAACTALACSGGKDANASTPTPTATPSTPTPTPMTTPTPTPVSIANAAFPPPPARSGTPPENANGIKRMVVPRLRVDHYVEDTPVISGAMQTPADAQYAIGYYPDFKVKPGESGNAIFSAHETWQHMQGPFFALHFAQPGDDIYVQMNDGREFRYRVTSYKRYEERLMPMGEIVNPTLRPFGEAWLTLITCGGRIVYDASGFGEYLDRDVVVAKLVK